MKRRAVILGGGALMAASGAGILLWPRQHRAIAARAFDWKGTDFIHGGTDTVDLATLPAPVFRKTPNCVVTAAQTLGPCHVNNVPQRDDVSEGKPGLPVRLAFRLVHSSDCRPIEQADIEIWHTDHRGIYSGREAAQMCTGGDAIALSGLAFRGRQLTGADGQAAFLTTYPGWYRGRAPHIHCRIVANGKELLISQLYFDDTLSDIVYGQHPDYVGRPQRDTRNGDDDIVPADASDHIFDFEKLEGGVLSATITIGVAA